MATAEQQLAALVATGQLDKATAALLALAVQSPDVAQRKHEAALRQLETRIATKVLFYLRDLARTAAAKVVA